MSSRKICIIYFSCFHPTALFHKNETALPPYRLIVTDDKMPSVPPIDRAENIVSDIKKSIFFLPFLSHSRHIAERHILRRSTSAENERQRHNHHNRFSFLASCLSHFRHTAPAHILRADTFHQKIRKESLPVERGKIL